MVLVEQERAWLRAPQQKRPKAPARYAAVQQHATAVPVSPAVASPVASLQNHSADT